MAEQLETVLMMVDPETKEAYRVGGADPKASGPLFFTTRDTMAAYAHQEGIPAYEVYEVPAGVLARMKGKPHWVDGKPGR